MPSDPLTTLDTITPGDVVMVSKRLKPKDGGDPYWWKTFRVVLAVDNPRSIETMILHMAIDPDKHERTVVVGSPDEVVVLLASHEIPQGVAAMMMKGIAKGIIKVVPF